MIALLVVTDGRHEFLRETIASARDALNGPITTRVMFDDTGDEQYRAQLRDEYAEFVHIGAPTRRGFGGAINRAWATLRRCEARFVFHLEQDFTFNRPVDLDAMARVLDQHPYLVQLALRRQPIVPTEIEAGGVVECWPDEFTECEHGDDQWLEHRLFFTTNPSLYRAGLCDFGWPLVERSEEEFTAQQLRNPDARFGYWGARESGEAVHHIGAERVGTGY